MDWLPSRYSLDEERAKSAECVVFVDVDGVLNVGARDSDTEAPILVNDESIEDAKKLYGRRKSHPMRDAIDKLVSISKRDLGNGEDSTYAKLACQGNNQVSDILIGRLARIIQAAGERRIIALSSKWQQYRNHIKRLEQHITRHLGESFTFEARTGLELSCTAECRLQTVGTFLDGLCSFRGENAPALKVLILEDFHITPMDGWRCGGQEIHSVAAAEQYVRNRMPASASHTVKLVHTYDEFTTNDGLLVQLGAGLNSAQLAESEEFLRTPLARTAEAEKLVADEEKKVADAMNGNENGKRKHDEVSGDTDAKEEEPEKALKLFKAPSLSDADLQAAVNAAETQT